MTIAVQTVIALDIALLLQLFGMIFALIIDPYISKRDKRIILISAVLVLTLVLQQNIGAYLQESSMTVVKIVTAVYGYSIRPAIICMFILLFGKIRKTWILVAVNAMIYCTAFFSDIAFRYGTDQIFRRGPLGFSCHIISGILLLQLAYLSIKKKRYNTNSFSFLPIVIVVLLVLGTIIDSFVLEHYYIDILTVTTVSCCVFYYIWLHLLFVAEHERDLKAEQRIKIMMSQIQPHFLFNTLTTIQTLCTVDPELAADTVQKFGVYLRRNIDSLSSDMLISFDKELEYIKAYSDIEMIRFPNVKLNFDIQDKDFELPALTVQPMVENAISHGVRIRKQGLVSVITRCIDGYHEIVIKDNGKGFDVDAVTNMDDTHIGLRNVRERIENICGGTLTVNSIIDEGSEVVIRIPV